MFENVSLRYAEHLPLVLHGLSFKVPGGMHLGICGRTGSGKSSLIACLLRLVEIERQGRILLDGVDTGKIGLRDLRQGVALVPQDPILFEGTLRRNLDQRGEHTDEEVWEVRHSLAMIVEQSNFMAVWIDLLYMLLSIVQEFDVIVSGVEGRKS